MSEVKKFAIPERKERKAYRKQAELHPSERKPDIVRPKVYDPRTGEIRIAKGANQSQRDKIIDWDLARQMLEMGCDADEVAGKMGVSRESVKKRCLGEQGLTWAEFEQQCQSVLKFKLRSMQVRVALGYDRKGPGGTVVHVKPDTQMLIHLGKQILGQSDKLDIKALYQGYIIEDSSGAVINASADEELPPGIIDGIAVVMTDDDEQEDYD